MLSTKLKKKQKKSKKGQKSKNFLKNLR